MRGKVSGIARGVARRLAGLRRSPRLGNRSRGWWSVPVCLLLALLLTTSGSALLGPPDASAHAPRHLYPRVLIVGDSISAGWFASSPAASYAHRLVTLLHASNRASGIWSQVIAVPGSHASEGVRELAALAAIPQADLVVVEFGTNDYGRHPLAPADFARSYTHLLDLLAGASPDATFVCVSVWGPVDHANAFGATPETYNAIIATACRQVPPRPGIYVDMTSLYAVSAFHGPQDHPSTIHEPTDAFHPNDAGHAAIAQAIFDALP